MNKYRKIRNTLLIAFSMFIMVFSAFESQAAGSVSISAAKSSVSVGDSVKVTVKATAPSDATMAPSLSIKYDTAALVFDSCDKTYGGGGGGLITVNDSTATIIFKASTAGLATVSVDAEFDGDGASAVSDSTSITVGGSSASETSTKSTLKSLKLNPGTLSPEFSADVTDYQLAVDSDVTTVAVSAITSDTSAQITEASGFSNLSMGSNSAKITVKGSDDSTKAYNITIMRGEAGSEDTGVIPGSVFLADSQLVVEKTIPTEIVPTGFTVQEMDYAGETIECAKFNMGDLYLLYLTAEDGSNGEFYLYYPDTDAFASFVQMSGIEGNFIIVLEPSEDTAAPDGFIQTSMQWSDKTVTAWMVDVINGGEEGVYSEASDYYLLYATSSIGNTGWYLYDTVEGTYQRYLQIGNAIEEAQEATTEAPTDEPALLQNNLFFILVIIIGVVALALLIALVVVLVKNRNQNSYRICDDSDKDGENNTKDEEEFEEEEPIKSKKYKNNKNNHKEKKASALNFLAPVDGEFGNEEFEEEVDSKEGIEAKDGQIEIEVKDRQGEDTDVLEDKAPDLGKAAGKKTAGFDKTARPQKPSIKVPEQKVSVKRSETVPKKLVQDIALDEDFEFEFLNLDDDK